jgi:hypothetical protein
MSTENLCSGRLKREKNNKRERSKSKRKRRGSKKKHCLIWKLKMMMNGQTLMKFGPKRLTITIPKSFRLSIRKATLIRRMPPREGKWSF